jgi:hypothetical protein
VHTDARREAAGRARLGVGDKGRTFDALLAMRQAEAVVRALELAGYEIVPRK